MRFFAACLHRCASVWVEPALALKREAAYNAAMTATIPAGKGSKMSNYYLVDWHNTEARGWTDIIPASILQLKENRRKLRHELVGKKGEVIIATFDVERRADGKLLLRYGGRNASANKTVGVYRGDMLIDPKDFRKTKTLSWRDEDEEKFEPIRVTIRSTVVEGVPLASTAKSSPRRSGRLKAIKQALGRSVGSCEACGCKGHPGYGDARHACFHVHHRRALAKGERLTKLNDLAYICANCHAVITALGEMPFDRFIKRLQRASY